MAGYMLFKRRIFLLCIITLLIFIAVPISFSQEINWYTTDQGGGTSSADDILLTGVIGQVDAVRMEGGSITVSGGYLPLPARPDLMFSNGFENNGEE